MKPGFLKDAYEADFTPEIRGAIRTAVRKAYAALKRLLATTPELRGPYGLQSRGDLINYFVAHHIRDELRKSRAAVEYVVEWNSKNTECHPVLQTPHFRITLCQLHRAKDFPRHAEFRENERASNQGTFFKFWEKGSEEETHISALLTHGWKSLQFLQLAVPHPKNREYLERFDLLDGTAVVSSRIHAPAQPATQPTAIPDLAIPKLRKKIEKKKDDQTG